MTLILEPRAREASLSEIKKTIFLVATRIRDKRTSPGIESGPIAFRRVLLNLLSSVAAKLRASFQSKTLSRIQTAGS